MQRLCFHTAGQYFSAAWSYCVIRTRQTGDGVEQDHYVVTALHQSFGFLVNDISYFDVVFCRLVEGRGDDFGIYATAHVRYFLRTLVDEQHDHIDLGVVLEDSVG